MITHSQNGAVKIYLLASPQKIVFTADQHHKPNKRQRHTSLKSWFQDFIKVVDVTISSCYIGRVQLSIFPSSSVGRAGGC